MERSFDDMPYNYSLARTPTVAQLVGIGSLGRIQLLDDFRPFADFDGRPPVFPKADIEK